MKSRLQFVRDRASVNLAQSGTTVPVQWVEFLPVAPGQVEMDPATGADLGAPLMMSGVVQAFGLVEPATTALRAHQEIQAGDLILDLAPLALVAIAPGGLYSGVTPLSGVLTKGARFEWGEAWYAQQKLGDNLAMIWDATFANQRLHTTILLRRAT